VTSSRPAFIAEHVPLAARTTLELGGPARYFCEVDSTERLLEALAWATATKCPWVVLGGGSNVVVPDAGVDGLVICTTMRGIDFDVPDSSGLVRVSAAAGEVWDALVEATVQLDWQGLECLSGIPGRVGAAPVQNIGAYGAEVGEVVDLVEAVDAESLTLRQLSREDCGFGYRSSLFKTSAKRWVITRVRFALRAHATPNVRYAELQRAVAGLSGARPQTQAQAQVRENRDSDRDSDSDGKTADDGRSATPTLAQVREVVLRLRRQKSMVLEAADVNRRSVGSFFMNPLVDLAAAERVVEAALSRGLVQNRDDVPQWRQPDGRVKLAAGWLIEKAGIAKGHRRGAVGVSTAHALALVHHGGGTTAQLLELAQDLRDAVFERFGVELVREPVALVAA
jgi:UDP-N-acetylmuramate dehydrogenase